MVNFVVKMDKRPLDLTQPLESSLQRFSDVVRLQESRFGRQHDVNLNEEIAAEMERTHRVDVRHLRVMVDGNPRELLEKVRPRRVPR